MCNARILNRRSLTTSNTWAKTILVRKLESNPPESWPGPSNPTGNDSSWSSVGRLVGWAGMESHCYAPMSAIRRLSLSLVAPPSAILECEEEGRTEWAQAEQGRADSLGIIITLSCSRPSGRVFLPSPRVSFSPSCPSFFYHRRGSLISFLFVRVAFNKLAFDFLPRLVQQPLCLAPVNSPAFDNRPRPTYTLSLLSSSCPPILLLRLFLPPPPFHVYTPRVPPFIQFFLLLFSYAG